MSRTYRDPIHKEIHLDSGDPVEALLIKLIDTKEFQRLRWIRQLGTSWYTFHGAEHSRFPHSLGAMHIARMMFEQIRNSLEDTNINDHRAAVLCAALLHDLGHGPFSHSFEKITNIKHEEWTRKIILSPETEVNQVLKSFDELLPTKVISILNKTYPVRFLSNLVSSQLDSDRFDYLLRDSHMTGTAYGQFDLNRIISNLAVNHEHDCLVVYGEKGMLAVEDYLYARYSMHLQIYQHKKSLATDSLLRKLFARLKVLARNRRISYIDEAVYNLLINPQALTVNDYLSIDDVTVIHHIKKWATENDFILKDLAKRFITRKLFKATKIEEGESADEVYKKKEAELRAMGLEPQYYLEKVTIASNPYSFYHPNKEDYSKSIFVQNNDGTLREISDVSNVVNALVQGDYENSWIVSVESRIADERLCAANRN